MPLDKIGTRRTVQHVNKQPARVLYVRKQVMFPRQLRFLFPRWIAFSHQLPPSLTESLS